MRVSESPRIALVSGSKFFVDGIQRVLEEKCNLKVVAKGSNLDEIDEILTKIKPELLLLDNRYVQLGLSVILDLINQKSPDTKVILLAKRKKERLHFPSGIYITKNTDSSKLRRMVEAARLKKWASPKKEPHAGDLGSNDCSADY